MGVDVSVLHERRGKEEGYMRIEDRRRERNKDGRAYMICEVFG